MSNGEIGAEYPNSYLKDLIIVPGHASFLEKVSSIPGQINSSMSTETNWLIKNNDGILVSGPDDILENSFKINTTQIYLFEPDLSEIERKIVSFLKNEELIVDELSIKLNLAVENISVSLSMLSMKNLIEEEAGKIYLKN